MPMHTGTIYLGGNIFASGSYNKYINHRIANTWVTVRKLDLLWKTNRTHQNGNQSLARS